MIGSNQLPVMVTKKVGPMWGFVISDFLCGFILSVNWTVADPVHPFRMRRNCYNFWNQWIFLAHALKSFLGWRGGGGWKFFTLITFSFFACLLSHPKNSGENASFPFWRRGKISTPPGIRHCNWAACSRHSMYNVHLLERTHENDYVLKRWCFMQIMLVYGLQLLSEK